MPEETEMETDEKWIGVDLDGTLAHHGMFLGMGSVGKMVKPVKERIIGWQKEGYKVKIFTARASEPDYVPVVQQWLKKKKLHNIEVTNKLDKHCVQIWDDRAIGVKKNTGMPIRSLKLAARPQAPLLEEAFPHENRPKLRD